MRRALRQGNLPVYQGINLCLKLFFVYEKFACKKSRYSTLKRNFSVGIELPPNDYTAFGIYVPAFDLPGYGCCSASNEQSLIPEIALDAILSVVQVMVADGYDVLNIEDAGIELYSSSQDYEHCECWLTIEADL